MVYVDTSVLVALCIKGAAQSDVRKTCAGGSVYGGRIPKNLPPRLNFGWIEKCKNDSTLRRLSKHFPLI
jgi:hypothetical protein